MICTYLVLVAGCVPTDRGSNGPELYVGVQGDGSCSVRELNVACVDVANYLRNTLSMSTDTYIAVTPTIEDAATLEAMAPVIKSLKDAGYNSVIGSITLEPNKP